MSETVPGLRVILDADDTSGGAARSFRTNMRGAQRDAQSFSSFLNTAGARANRQYTVGLQQAGFQVGDFFTQVASGQNPLVAFIQQGTQLAGAFGKWGAIIGGAGAVVGALAVALLEGRENAKSFEDAFDDWVDSLDGLDAAVDAATTPIEELQEKYGELDGAIRKALEAQVQWNVFQARQGFRETFGALTRDDTLSTLAWERGPRERGPGAHRELTALRQELGLTREEFDLLLGSMRDLEAAALTDSIEEQKAAVEEASRVMGDLVDLSDEDLSDGMREFGKNLSDVLLRLREMEQQIREAESAGIGVAGGVLTGGAGDTDLDGGQGGDMLGAGTIRFSYKNPGGATGADVPVDDEAVAVARDLERAFASIIRRIESSTRSARSFDDALNQVLRTAGEIVGTGLFGAGPAGSAVNALLGVEAGGIVQALFSARGNAFRGGDVVPFALGGVVSRPTAFPMPGGIGVMAERDEEAIMPLKRGPDGRLGVASFGGRSVNVNMNISTPDADGFRRSRAQIASEMARAIDRAREF